MSGAGRQDEGIGFRPVRDRSLAPSLTDERRRRWIARLPTIAMIVAMPDSRVDLESKLAMLEHTVDALSGELIEQQQRLDRLQADVTAILQHLKRPRSDEGIEPHDTRPPHWGGQ